MNELAIHQNAAPLAVNGGMDVFKMGEVFAKSGFFTDANDPAKAIVKILAGQAMGIDAFTAMTAIHVIKGKPSVSAGLMATKVKASAKYNYKVLRLDDECCQIEFFENGQSVGVSEFTRDDAKRAGTQNVDRFARNMLFARAMSNGVKWYAPDVFAAAVYTPEEMGAVVDGEGEFISLPPASQSERPTAMSFEQKRRIEELGPLLYGPTWLQILVEYNNNVAFGRWDFARAAAALDAMEEQALQSGGEAHPDSGPADSGPTAEPPREIPANNGWNKKDGIANVNASLNGETKPRPPHFAQLRAVAQQMGLDNSKEAQAARIAATNKWRATRQLPPIRSWNDVTKDNAPSMIYAMENGELTWASEQPAQAPQQERAAA